MKHNRISRLIAMSALAISVIGSMSVTQAAGGQCVKPLGADGCKSSIQAAIDAAAPGETISIYPGAYDETAAGRSILGIGSYQFGLFVGKNRNGITLQGVDAKGKKINDDKKVMATVTTNATNNFGPSGIFIEGDSVTISGLRIGANFDGQNKTIEIIGDDFSLLNSDIADLYGSVYLNDWQFNEGTNTSYLKSYRIEGNNFQNGVSLDIASGAGFSGPVKNRVIKKNAFSIEDYWPAISFNGSGTGVPWFTYSVGGAVIRDNTFVNTFIGDGDLVHLQTQGHIRARGTYDNNQFDWDNYFNENKFNRAYVVGPKPPKELRAYSYFNGEYTFNNVRRIGAIEAAESANAQPGDTVRAKR